MTPHVIQQERSFRQLFLAMLGLCLVIIMVAIDQTVVGTALPTIVAELKGFDLYAWVATSYLLTSVVTVPVFGRLGDHFGRKYFILAAIAIFTIASVLCGLAHSMMQLVLARGLQGIGGGMLIGTAFATVPDLFPERHVRIRWQVLLSASFGIANAFGPWLGGFLTEFSGWRSVFYVNLPIGIICLLTVLRFMPLIRHTAQDEKIKIDWLGSLLIAASLGSIQMFMELLPHRGLTFGMVILAISSAIAFSALVYWEKRCEQPILPPEIFRNATLRRLFLLSLITGLMMFGILFYTPLMLQGGFGLSAHQAGLLITPLVVFITVGSITNGRIITRIPNASIMLYLGYAMLIACTIGLVTTHAGTSHVLLMLYLMLGGMGLGFIMPNLTIFTQEMAGRFHFGVATGLLQSARMTGGMIGTALIGTIVSHGYIRHLDHSLASLNASRWLPQLDDPQILVSKSDQASFAALLKDGAQSMAILMDAARDALISSIHLGQAIALIGAVFALWQVRKLPVMKMGRDEVQSISVAE